MGEDMSKPEKLMDLLREGHISLGEVRKIASDIFDGETTAAGPEGYVITAAKWDELPDHVQGFIVKGILQFKVENVLDAADEPEVDGVGGPLYAAPTDDEAELGDE
jgi:hypothetical protein